MKERIKPSDRRRASDSKRIDLDLLPFMNLMTLLIPFLLASMQFMTLAVIDVSMPVIAPIRSTDPSVENPDPLLALTIGITETEYVIAGNAERLAAPVSIEIADLTALTALMLEIRAERPAVCAAPPGLGSWSPPEGCNLIVAPDSNVLYERIIEVMDAARGPEEALLFPYVVVAGGFRQ